MRVMLKLLSAVLLTTQIISCHAVDSETKKIIVGNTALSVEIADTAESRKTGLMNRKKLAPDRGMLFIFEKEQKLSFWMKNTSIPLSIAYISKSGLIREIHDLEPFSQSPVNSSHSVLYALEVNRGWFEEQGVSAGDSIQFSP